MLQALEVYKLPEQMATKVQEQYERDVARVHGGGVVSMDAEYKSFLAELGGGPPPELMGLDVFGKHCPLHCCPFQASIAVHKHLKQEGGLLV